RFVRGGTVAAHRCWGRFLLPHPGGDFSERPPNHTVFAPAQTTIDRRIALVDRSVSVRLRAWPIVKSFNIGPTQMPRYAG
ncbi:hypothetical protein, partial [uncultured Salinisphaera sp.]|uniref:hypothetical protein n=1 Tax=uncultured Salinisphaera sp. TaxID=359372 RepID=UPI0032B0FBB7